MKKCKQLLSMLLSVMIAAAAFPSSIGAYALDAEQSGDDTVLQSGDFEYKLAEDETKLCITKYVGESENVEIPAQIDGKTVSTLSDEAFKDNEIVKEIYIPETISNVEVEVEVFDNSEASAAQSDLTACGDIDKPSIDRREVIGANPFINCKNLEKVEVAPENEFYSSIDGVFFTKVEYSQSFFWDDKHFDKLVLLYYPSAKKDERYDVPENVRYIGTRLDYLDKHTATHNTNAFCDCVNLKNVFIYDNVKGILYGEFFNQDLTIYCYPDTQAYFYASYFEIPYVELQGFFDYDNHFYDYPDFEFEINLDDEILIRKYNGKDTVVKIPEWVGDRPVTEISNRAFMDTNVKEVYLPRFFERTEYLNSEYDDIDTDLNDLFGSFESKDNRCRVKRNGYDVAAISFGSPGASPFADCPDLEYIEVDPQNKKYKSIDGVLFTCARYARYDTEDDSLLALVQYPQAKKCDDYTIPENVICIGTGLNHMELLKDPYREFAFYDCPDLGNVHIPDEVVFIRNGEFGECNNLAICANNDSYAEYYAEVHDISFKTETFVLSMYGDVTGDNAVSTKDTLYIMRHVVDIAQLNDQQLIAADVNKSNTVNTLDAFLIQRYVLGIDMGYGIGELVE